MCAWGGTLHRTHGVRRPPGRCAPGRPDRGIILGVARCLRCWQVRRPTAGCFLSSALLNPCPQTIHRQERNGARRRRIRAVKLVDNMIEGRPPAVHPWPAASRRQGNTSHAVRNEPYGSLNGCADPCPRQGFRTVDACSPGKGARAAQIRAGGRRFTSSVRHSTQRQNDVRWKCRSTGNGPGYRPRLKPHRPGSIYGHRRRPPWRLCRRNRAQARCDHAQSPRQKQPPAKPAREIALQEKEVLEPAQAARMDGAFTSTSRGRHHGHGREGPEAVPD